MASITAVNAIYTISITGLFSAPQQLQQFSADDIFDTEAVEQIELQMGVDGHLTGGFVYAMVKQGITLMADSPSNDIFEQWRSAEKAARDIYWANASVTLPAIGKSYAMTRGALSSYPSFADAKKTLQPRKYAITWGDVSPARI